jgi:TolB-like protein
MSPGALALPLLLVAGAAAPAAVAQASASLALLPFENVSGSMYGARVVMPVLETALRDRGYRVVAGDALEPFLSRHRVRTTSALAPAHLEALGRELGVEMALVGTVALFDDSATNPQWGLSARALALPDGRVLWAHSSGATGGDFTTVLGLGTVTSSQALAGRVVRRLLQDFPPATAGFVAPPAGGRGFRLGGFRPGFRSPTLDEARPRRVAVLPFENRSERKGAARIVTEIAVTTLFRLGRFEVVEPGRVMDALVAAGVVPYGAIDEDTLAAIQRTLGADAVILGTVWRYSEGLKRAASNVPELEVDARMLDARTGRILWMGASAGTGEDTEVALELGRIRSVVPLTARMLREMLETL